MFDIYDNLNSENLFSTIVNLLNGFHLEISSIIVKILNHLKPDQDESLRIKQIFTLARLLLKTSLNLEFKNVSQEDLIDFKPLIDPYEFKIEKQITILSKIPILKKLFSFGKSSLKPSINFQIIIGGNLNLKLKFQTDQITQTLEEFLDQKF